MTSSHLSVIKLFLEYSVSFFCDDMSSQICFGFLEDNPNHLPYFLAKIKTKGNCNDKSSQMYLEFLVSPPFSTKLYWKNEFGKVFAMTCCHNKLLDILEIRLSA